MEGDVSLSAEDKPPPLPSLWTASESTPTNGDDEHDFEEDGEDHHDWLEGHPAIKFLLAGGIAGAGKDVWHGE